MLLKEEGAEENSLQDGGNDSFFQKYEFILSLALFIIFLILMFSFFGIVKVLRLFTI